MRNNANLDVCIDKLYLSYSKSEKIIVESHRKSWFSSQILTIPHRIKRNIFKKRLLNYIQKYSVVQRLNIEEDGPVVSLTSFPKRIDTVHMAIESIFRQTNKPSQIILWLSSDEFKGEDSLPCNLLRLKDFGLEIVFVKGNIKAHKKYYYALKKYNNKNVITIDDDLYYPSDMIARLLDLHKDYPNAVCANIVRTINITDGNKFGVYRSWRKKSGEQQSVDYKNLAIGMGGVLYPKGFCCEGLFDVDKISMICPLADDLWLKAHETKCGIKVASGKTFFPHPIVLPNTIKSGLQKQNMSHRNLNDEQWRSVVQYLGLDAQDFEAESTSLSFHANL